MENSIFQQKPSKAYFKMSLPLVFSMVVTLIYNLADTYFVAKTDNTLLVAGVSLAAPVFTLLMGFGNIFAQGGASLISRLMGKDDLDGVRRVSSFCYIAALLLGAVTALIILVFRGPALSLLGADSDTLPYASDYLTVLAAGAPLIVVSFVHSNHLRSEGMSKESMIGTVGGAVVNIILDPVFILLLGMGAKGAAVATVAGYLASDLYFLFVVLKKSKILTVNPKNMKIPMGHVGQILGIGIPAAFANVMTSISVVLMNQYLLPYGNEKIAAMGIASRVIMIAQLVLTGFAFGGQPLFGYFYGAMDKQKLRELLVYVIKFISLLALAFTVLLFAAAPVLLRIIMDHDGIVAAGTAMLRWQSTTNIFAGILVLMNVVFQSCGKIGESFLLSISRQGVVFVIVLVVAHAIAGYGGVIATQAIADLLSAALALGMFYFRLYRELRE